MIAVIDYGAGNIFSVENALRYLGQEHVLTDDPDTIRRADAIILPGVGAFPSAMQMLHAHGLTELLQQQAKEKPFLGICLGMQLLGRKSEEGKRSGLGLIPFDNIRFHFPQENGLKIPHMGWDIVDFKQESPLLQGINGAQQRYYFVHTYHAVCDSENNVLMTCDYGYEFAAAVCNKNVSGVQFHPEKSHDFGMRLLENFVKRC